MEKHLTLVGVLNIVYRSFLLLTALFLFALAAWFGDLISMLVDMDVIQPHEIPIQLFTVVPLILVVVAALVAIISIVGILGGVGVLRRKEWGRIMLLVVSFINLLRVPLGTALGIYSIYILMNADSVKLFSPAGQQTAAAP
jgi:hypothetical protein